MLYIIRAQIWTVAALDDISQVLPFPMIGVDSDNDSEFINAHQTPYQRVMASDQIPEKYKSRLKEQFINADPIKLKRLVDKKKEILEDMVSKKNQKEFRW